MSKFKAGRDHFRNLGVKGKWQEKKKKKKKRKLGEMQVCLESFCSHKPHNGKLVFRAYAKSAGPVKTPAKALSFYDFWVDCYAYTKIGKNSADPDQSPQNTASDHSLHCLLKLQEVMG